MAQPELLTDSLLPRIFQAYEKKGETPVFTLNRYEDDAKKVLKQDRYAGELLLGMIAGLRRDADAVGKHYKTAAHLANSVATHHNFVHAFERANDYSGAKAAVLASLETLDKSSPEDLELVSDNALFYGLVDEAVQLCDKLKKLKSKEDANLFLEGVQAAAIPHLQDLLMAVYAVLARHKLIITRRATVLQQLYGSSFFEYVFSVLEKDAAKLAQHQYEICEAVAAYEVEHNLTSSPVSFQLERELSV